MSSIQYGKFEFDSTRNIRETEDEIVVPAILDRESILQYGNVRGYRSAGELQAAAFWGVVYCDGVDPFDVTLDLKGLFGFAEGSLCSLEIVSSAV